MTAAEATSLFSLQGRLAVVTGCRRGIGLAMAGALATAGADIVGVSQHLEPTGSAAQTVVEGHGRRFTAIRCDLGDRGAVTALGTRLADHDPPVDILVNNAGTIVRAPAVEHDDEAWDRCSRSTSRARSCSPDRSGGRCLPAARAR